MTPSLVDLAATVEGRSTSAASRLHGSSHWRRVAIVGRELAARTPNVDPLVVALFAILHDSQRENDGRDPGHGARGARLAVELCHEWLTPRQLDQLIRACRHHHDGKVSLDDPTIGACWDVDRLNLWRVGITPNPRLLSTAAARDPETIKWARQLQTAPVDTWEDILRSDRRDDAPPASPERTSDTVRLYHGTSAHLEEAIAQEGLRASRDGTGPYLTPDFQYATSYAVNAALLHEHEHPGSPMLASVLRVEVPASELRLHNAAVGFLGASRDMSEYVVTTGVVHPDRITVARRFPMTHLRKRTELIAKAARITKSYVSKRPDPRESETYRVAQRMVERSRLSPDTQTDKR